MARKNKGIRLGKRKVFDERNKSFNEYPRMLYYDSQTRHVFMLTKKGGKTKRQYLRASLHKQATKSSIAARGRYGKKARTQTFNRLRWWLSSKAKATKFDPEQYRYAPIDNSYGKTKHYPI